MLLLAKLSLLLFFASCDRPDCQNKNLVFDTKSPESKAYKDELLKELDRLDQSQLSYWLQAYDKQDGNEFLSFHIQGEGLCAILHLEVENWQGIEYIRKNKAVGSRGAEFRGLKFAALSDSISTRFLYQGQERIID